MADPFFASVVLLAVNESGSGTSFIDQSSAAHALTANGNAQWDATSPPPGVTSMLLLDGARDFLSALDSPDWTLGSGDFTVEAYVKLTAAPGVNAAVFDQLVSVAANDRAWLFAFSNAAGTTGQGLEFVYSTNGSNQTFVRRDGTLNNATLYHLAASRSGNNLRLFIDGVQLGATQDVTGVTISNSSKPIGLGGSAETAGFDVNGRFVAMRITKGVARYTANFTIPSLPFDTSATTTPTPTPTSGGYTVRAPRLRDAEELKRERIRFGVLPEDVIEEVAQQQAEEPKTSERERINQAIQALESDGIEWEAKYVVALNDAYEKAIAEAKRKRLEEAGVAILLTTL